MRSALLAVLLLITPWTGTRAGTTAVTAWTDEADAFGDGLANWHSLAVMHMAMHDALNAAEPTYARWAPPATDEPSGAGASPQAAAEVAAATVLRGLHPNGRDAIAGFLADRLALLPPGPALERGVALGTAVGAATLRRRADDGFERRRNFVGSDVAGAWRPTPPRHITSGTTTTLPFLFPARDAMPGQPPPVPGSERYRDDVDATRRLGGGASAERTPAQTEAAIFWAYQSTQRGYVHLAATLIDNQPGRFSLAEQARTMSQVTAAMADAAVLIWVAKERWNFWRPVDAIRSGAFGVAADPAWQSFIETPPHPEYPSGHAADCYAGAGVITAAGLAPELLPATPAAALTYTAQSAPSVAPSGAAARSRPAEVWSTDMGPAPAPVELTATTRHFPSLQAAAAECADSRIWAGAHFPSANEESRRIAALIVRRATEVLPPLP